MRQTCLKVQRLLDRYEAADVPLGSEVVGSLCVCHVMNWSLRMNIDLLNQVERPTPSIN